MEFIPESDELFIQQLNRPQNTNKVWIAKISDNSLNNIFTDTDAAWLDTNDNIQWLKDNNYHHIRNSAAVVASRPIIPRIAGRKSVKQNSTTRRLNIHSRSGPGPIIQTGSCLLSSPTGTINTTQPRTGLTPTAIVDRWRAAASNYNSFN